ncbi:bidirectional sugar transporter SWEET7 [Triticum aestivum]|uniref:bidirectional sugar transporter SWEET7 n=1 Tax=Triticum aestivum TaxID=4565 RepID=UPI001ABCA031|nr:bidirectional sugar transporter SWEET7-like [Triticum aestivum]
MGALAAADASMSGAAICFMFAGYVATFSLFYSHFCKVKKMNEDGEVGETKIVPFYFVLLSCLIWIAYAVVDIKADWAVFILNALGVVVMVYCIWSFARLDQTIRLYAFIFVPAEGLGVVILAIAVYFSFDTVNDKNMWLGVIGGIAGTVMYIVSMATDTRTLLQRQEAVGQGMRGVLQELQLLFASSANAGSWCMYGVLYAGNYVAIANGIGLGFCALQFVIYGWIKLGITAR